MPREDKMKAVEQALEGLGLGEFLCCLAEKGEEGIWGVECL